MYAAKDIGLGAIPDGVRARILVIDLQEGEDEEGKPIRNPRAYLNPEIVSVSDETVELQRGLSVDPGAICRGRTAGRAAACAGRTSRESGTRRTSTACSPPACSTRSTISNGVLFIDHISRLKRGMLLKKLDKARKAG